MSTPTVEHATDIINHALSTATVLIDDATWLHNEAYLPRGRDRDRPTLAIPMDPTDPDATPGERLDLGLPTDAVLRRYHRAACLVVAGARLAGDALLLAAGQAVPLGGSPWAAEGPLFAVQVELATSRLRALRHYGIERIPPRARSLGWSGAERLLSAHWELRQAMPNPEGKPYAPSHRRCSNCREPHIEPDRTSDSECPACRMYRKRHDGQARPYRRNAAAYEAKARREERGEGHGNEDGGVQNGTYREGSWERHHGTG